MIIHVFTKLGKCHCAKLNGHVILSNETLYIECDEELLETIKSVEPCSITLRDKERDITLDNCTVHGKTIKYSEGSIK